MTIVVELCSHSGLWALVSVTGLQRMGE